jgi:hypothetical protein
VIVAATSQSPSEACDVSIDMSVPSQSAVQTSADLVLGEVTEKLVSVISAIPVRSNHVFISSFDPSLHDFGVWCSEVDHVRN